MMIKGEDDMNEKKGSFGTNFLEIFYFVSFTIIFIASIVAAIVVTTEYIDKKRSNHNESQYTVYIDGTEIDPDRVTIYIDAATYINIY